ncbi:MAG TPA: NUDIX domain-containing protein, partial [Candidatus Hydrogenedentes bacterium]|nr:NUDIX domain-containing protein [Candidatus Hydrogenedentota bacterium]
QAMMELGAVTCLPRGPRCDACPVRAFCAARRMGTQEDRPVRAPKKMVPHYDVVVGVICRRGRYLIGKRPAGGLLGGLWEFPGGKVAPGEDREAALRRELREELGVAVRVGACIATVRHAYSHFRVTLHVYRCVIASGTPRPLGHTALAWVARGDLRRYAFPKANLKFIDSAL